MQNDFLQNGLLQTTQLLLYLSKWNESLFYPYSASSEILFRDWSSNKKSFLEGLKALFEHPNIADISVLQRFRTLAFYQVGNCFYIESIYPVLAINSESSTSSVEAYAWNAFLQICLVKLWEVLKAVCIHQAKYMKFSSLIAIFRLFLTSQLNLIIFVTFLLNS